MSVNVRFLAHGCVDALIRPEWCDPRIRGPFGHTDASSRQAKQANSFGRKIAPKVYAVCCSYSRKLNAELDYRHQPERSMLRRGIAFDPLTMTKLAVAATM
jgi:hypothetical protein